MTDLCDAEEAYEEASDFYDMECQTPGDEMEELMHMKLTQNQTQNQTKKKSVTLCRKMWLHGQLSITSLTVH